MLNFFNILALLLALPLQMLTFVRTLEHMIEHKDTRSELAHQYSPDEEDHHHHADEGHSVVDKETAVHQHGEDEPFHSHAKDLSDVLVQIGVPSFHSSVFLTSDSKEDHHQFPTKVVNSQTIRLSLLRPPIA